ncbi:MAG TPA: adenylate/guanylate cyclase domain-containing protein [Gaiellaceae bacterium]|nr:adenylate/guanylate cyclase domain-containing protein [Gaiellaceae bacterium]
MSVCVTCGRMNADDARFCSSCGSVLAASPSDVRKTVTIVRCDVTGSTALGERLDPESLRHVMGRYFDEMARVIERHGGTVEKFIGDAVMAVFGIPVLHEDDAIRAVRAAAEMREALAALNVELVGDLGVLVEVRTGVTTGEVIAGDPSAGQAFVTGDAANTAARLESSAAPGEILVGDPTYRLVSDAVEVERIRPLRVKGKAEPLAAWRLLAVRPHAEAFVRRLDAPMVGRTGELAVLRDEFDQVTANRSCRLVTILGEAGIGKSRLRQSSSRPFECRRLSSPAVAFPTGKGSRTGHSSRSSNRSPRARRNLVCAIF